jgi:DNA primase
MVLPDAHDPRLRIERELLKLVLQRPDLVGRIPEHIDVDDFTHPAYQALWAGVRAAWPPPGESTRWLGAVDAHLQGPLGELLSAIAVEPLHSGKEPTAGYAQMHDFRLRELTAMRRIADVKSHLQRTNPVTESEQYHQLFGELAALEQRRRELRAQTVGME